VQHRAGRADRQVEQAGQVARVGLDHEAARRGAHGGRAGVGQGDGRAGPGRAQEGRDAVRPQDGPPGGGRDGLERAHPVQVPRVAGLEHQVGAAVEGRRVVAGHVRLGPRRLVLVEAERGALGDQDIAAGDGIGEGPRPLRVMAVEPDVAGEGEHAVAGGDAVAAGPGHVVVHVEPLHPDGADLHGRARRHSPPGRLG
jgi:hypothetical protein